MRNKESRALWIPGFSASCRKRGEVLGMLREPLQWLSPWCSESHFSAQRGWRWTGNKAPHPRRDCCCSEHSCQCHGALKLYSCISLLSSFFLATGQKTSQCLRAQPRTGCVLASLVRGVFQSKKGRGLNASLQEIVQTPC